VVRVKTPDPYTPSREMLNQAKKNSEAAKDNSKNGMKKGRSHVESKYANGIAASIYSRDKDGSLHKVLGQFEFDKDTNW
jgi:hypothetical protein